MLKTIMYFFARLSTGMLMAIPTIIGFIIFTFMQTPTPKNAHDPMQTLLWASGFFFWSLAGIPVIIRKHVSTGFFQLKGWAAIFSGLLVMAIFWAVALLPWLSMKK